MPTGIYKRTQEHKEALSVSHKGEKSHFYKDGRTLKRYYCIDCKKELKCYRSKRCKKCSAKEKWNRLEYKEKISGEKSNFYIDGRTSNKYYCVDCDDEIKMRSIRCRSCAAKMKWTNPNLIKRMSGETHPNWRGGKTKKYCVGCKKEISQQAIERCNSCSTKMKWQDSKYRRKNKANLGNKHTEETKKKMGVRTRLNWANGCYDKVFKSPTNPEKKIMVMLKELGIDYIFQYRPKDFSRIYDFYTPIMNLLIEFDGIYWHSLPGAKEKDTEKTNYAKNNNYTLLRFNENNIDSFTKVIGGRI